MKVGYALVLLIPLSTVAHGNCDTGEGARPPSQTRLKVHADGTVSDPRSKLMWMRCSLGQRWSGSTCEGAAAARTWAAAQAAANEVNLGGTYFFNDWRLPQLREVATLVDMHCKNPRLDLAVFPSTPARFYWTASRRAGNAPGTLVYALSFGPEGVKFTAKDESHLVRLVRSDQ